MQAVAKELAIQLPDDGIRVAALAPGAVNTPMHANDDTSSQEAPSDPASGGNT